MSALPDLETAVRSVRALPPLPSVAAEVLASITDERMDVDDIARKIARDTALAARTLRVANSPYYGLQARIGSVQEAVVVLGFSSVRSLVIASALTLTLGHHAGPHFDQHRFWRHSLATAAAASAMAPITNASAGLLFLAGLMHDIGRLALFASFPKAFEAVALCRERNGLDWIEAERTVLGYDHAALGGALCEHWRFPAAIGAGVAGHHVPLGDGSGGFADVLHVANAIAHALDLAGDPDAAVPPILADSWARLDIDWDSLQKVLADTERQFEALMQILA